MQTDNIIKVVCEECGKTTEIPLKYFYDGYEGLFFCKECGGVLDVDSD